MDLKLKAEATDPDGAIAQVQFFANTNLLGVVTNPPFNLIWEVDYDFETHCGEPMEWRLRAVAIDDLGATNESAAVSIWSSLTRPSFPVAEMVSPRDGAVFAAPASFVFRAEVLASDGFAGPVEFFVGTNSVGKVDDGTRLTATTPPSSVIVSNLLEGEYRLTMRFYEPSGGHCVACVIATNTIRVITLRAQAPRLTSSGQFEFDIQTSLPGEATIIQRSANLLDWLSIETNYPSSTTFTFTESSPATNAHRFYRLALPSHQP